jgi:uncharacterized protein YutE (UPF0331/DUF86 family)
MVDRDVVFAKVAIIKRCLQRIKDVTRLDPKSLEALDVQEIFILNLQRAAQAAIDLAAHLVASEGLGVPQDLKENFRLLQGANVIAASLAARMQNMVGFRNIAVHEYEAIDPAVLKSILTHNLRDLEEFYATVMKHFGLEK